MTRAAALIAVALAAAATALPAQDAPVSRGRARDLGVAPGIFRPGAHNAITDVAGVRVGHATVVAGDSVRTGVTAVLPHGGNAYHDRVPAALVVGNGFGKLVGATQLRELGELETPILLTCTLCVWRAAEAMADWMLAKPGMQDVRSINPVVGETNDGTLNAIRSHPVTAAHVVQALESAQGGAVEDDSARGGADANARPLDARGDGSIMIVVATDAPLSDRNLERLAARALLGLGRTGSSASNGSGDYVLAFSTAPGVRRRGPGAPPPAPLPDSLRRELTNDDMSPLFQAVVEATEEAIYNSLVAATTTTANGRTVQALPLDRLREVLRKYGIGAR